MEGFGVATAAAGAGVRFAEVRTISNLVGLRDRGAWRITEALAALGEVGRVLGRLGW
jgi:futalosine hydrolase